MLFLQLNFHKALIWKNLKSKLEKCLNIIKSKFPGLVYRIKDPKAVFLLFNSGKVVAGSKSIEDAQNASKMLTQELIKQGIDVDNSNENYCPEYRSICWSGERSES